MPRTKNIDGVIYPLTAEEEIAYDAEKAVWAAGAAARAWAMLREERNTKLDETDWTQMPDAPSEGKTAWATYRQALRDLPQTTPGANNPTWPIVPES